MTATMVGVDWGMVALGINTIPRKQRETNVRSTGPTQPHGEHAAISNLSVEVRTDDVFSTLGPISAVVTMSNVVGPLLHGSVEMFSLPAEQMPACSDHVVTIVERPAFNADGPSPIDLKSLAYLHPAATTIRNDHAPAITSLIAVGGIHCIMSSDLQVDRPTICLSAAGMA